MARLEQYESKDDKDDGSNVKHQDTLELVTKQINFFETKEIEFSNDPNISPGSFVKDLKQKWLDSER